MKPSELALLWKQKAIRGDTKNVYVGHLTPEQSRCVLLALRHHEALVKALRGVINGKCTFQGAEQLLATIKRETK